MSLDDFDRHEADFDDLETDSTSVSSDISNLTKYVGRSVVLSLKGKGILADAAHYGDALALMKDVPNSTYRVFKVADVQSLFREIASLKKL